MEVLLLIVEIVALVCVSALCVVLIVVLFRANDALKVLQKDLSEMSEKAKPVLENMEYITDRFKSVSTKIDDQVGIVKDSLVSLRSAADNVVEFEKRMQDTLETPILRISAILGAFLERLTAFFAKSRS